MPSNDREVFDHLLSDKDTALQVDFLTYAVFAHEKREWIQLFENRNSGQSPTQADIDNWISNITESQFAAMRAGAENFFVEAAEALFEQRLEAERQNILRSAIVAEVKAAGAFSKQLALALTTAILAPLILGAVIGLAILYDRGMFTPSSIAEHFSPKQESAQPNAAPVVPQPAPIAPSKD